LKATAHDRHRQRSNPTARVRVQHLPAERQPVLNCCCCCCC